MIIAGILGAYTGENFVETAKNIAKAEAVAIQLAEAGIGYHCPHLNSRNFHIITPLVNYEWWLEMNNEILRRTYDAVILVPGWETSNGTVKEKQLCEDLLIPVFDDLGSLKSWIDANRNELVYKHHFESKFKKLMAENSLSELIKLGQHGIVIEFEPTC